MAFGFPGSLPDIVGSGTDGIELTIEFQRRLTTDELSHMQTAADLNFGDGAFTIELDEVPASRYVIVTANTITGLAAFGAWAGAAPA